MNQMGPRWQFMAAVDGASAESALTRALFRVRYQLGAWLGWDDAARQLPVPGCTETTLSQRLPVNLRGSATGLDLGPPGFSPLYRTSNEWAAELSNGTVHAVLHLAWVEQGKGRHRGQMGVYATPAPNSPCLLTAGFASRGPARVLTKSPPLVRGTVLDFRTSGGLTWMARTSAGGQRGAMPRKHLPRGGEEHGEPG
jgi:hypothetical protein